MHWDELQQRPQIQRANWGDAHMGTAGALVYPGGSPEGYLTVASAAGTGGGVQLDGDGYVAERAGGGSMVVPLDGEGYVQERVARCPRCRARTKWCTCELSDETRL